MEDAPTQEPATAEVPRRRIRRPTLVQAPLLLGTLILATVTIASLLWGLHPDNERTPAWWLIVVTGAVLTTAGIAGIRGCFLDVTADEVRDVVAWITVHRFDPAEVETARVARGVWRLYVVDLADGTRLNLLGASPQQWPTRLLPGAWERDVADLDALMGRS
jgi:hypothetical protein